MDDGGVSELEGTVDKRNMMRKVVRQMFDRNLKIPEYFMGCFLRIYFKSLETRVFKLGVKTFRDSHLF